MARIALIDDHESVRLGVEAVLVRDGHDVVFSGPSAGDYATWRLTTDAPSDVALIDITLGDGTTVRENVRSVGATCTVVVYSVADRPALVREALQAGAAGVISKSAPMADLVRSVNLAVNGEPINTVEWANAVEGDTEFLDAQLTGREREALRLYAAGLPLRAVAEQMRVAFSTAKEHIARIRAKYVGAGRPAPTKIDLLHRAIEDGLLEPPSDA